jgi:hypothetical protein
VRAPGRICASRNPARLEIWAEPDGWSLTALRLKPERSKEMFY